MSRPPPSIERMRKQVQQYDDALTAKQYVDHAMDYKDWSSWNPARGDIEVIQRALTAYVELLEELDGD